MIEIIYAILGVILVYVIIAIILLMPFAIIIGFQFGWKLAEKFVVKFNWG